MLGEEPCGPWSGSCQGSPSAASCGSEPSSRWQRSCHAVHAVHLGPACSFARTSQATLGRFFCLEGWRRATNLTTPGLRKRLQQRKAPLPLQVPLREGPRLRGATRFPEEAAAREAAEKAVGALAAPWGLRALEQVCDLVCGSFPLVLRPRRRHRRSRCNAWGPAPARESASWRVAAGRGAS